MNFFEIYFIILLLFILHATSGEVYKYDNELSVYGKVPDLDPLHFMKTMKGLRATESHSASRAAQPRHKINMPSKFEILEETKTIYRSKLCSIFGHHFVPWLKDCW